MVRVLPQHCPRASEILVLNLQSKGRFTDTQDKEEDILSQLITTKRSNDTLASMPFWEPSTFVSVVFGKFVWSRLKAVSRGSSLWSRGPQGLQRSQIQ